ncbi:cytoplasmic protein [Lysinibacillus sp. 2017]|uniref:metal-sensitive transcriptional regulator n=1 Tax=unclassified Lysinibacillus TaxID=2636778 RepID=UPI000D52A27A|nr:MULTISPECIES: metal-sensitive transcriptional regulator [unclassified Lysinibacillus]AWE07195.1 cytoplasmic protein [Lysinibacillus sp. 2017]TGN34653.1 metal-sensitive transcriptional regulator [Lysinibacillus sp. S2017]
MMYDDKVKLRLKKADGQLNAILRMMEEEKDCKDVITQLSAVRSAVDRTIGIIVAENLVDCISETQSKDEKDQLVKQAIELLVKSR